MVEVLTSYLAELRAPPQYPSCEPEVDDVDAEEDRKLRELDALHSGAIQRGLLRAGRGERSPQEGDLVYVHLSVRTEGGKVVESTRPEEAGSGVPRAFVMGKGQRAPRGWELAFQDMRQGERAVLKIRPDYSYAQPGCTLRPPRGYPPDAAFVLDTELLAWYDKSAVRVVGPEGDIFKCSLEAAEEWETPRAPFEVAVSVAARVPSSDGTHGAQQPYFQTAADAPLQFAVGDGSVHKELEEAICSLTKGERAFFSTPVRPAGAGPWTKVAAPPAGCDRVEYELKLLSMLQVRDLVGDGSVTKRRVREGRGAFPADCPMDDNAVSIHYTATPAGTTQVVYDSRGADGAAPPLRFDTGMDAVPPAIDMAVRLMTPGELSLGLEEGAAVDFLIELVGYERQATWAAMSGADKLARAEALKEQGNAVFRLGASHYSFARQKWAKARQLVDQAFDLDTQDQVEAATQLKVGCLLNLALAAQREGKYTECFGWCDKALREVGDHPKALYRRGTTHALLGNQAEAEADLRLVVEQDPSTRKEVDKQLALMRARGASARKKQREEFGAFFPAQPPA